MALALIVVAAFAAYVVYHSDIVGLVLSLPDGNEDFVFTGECQGGGKMAESASLWSIPPKKLGTVLPHRDAGDSPRPVI